MKVIVPTIITGAMLVSSTIPETDHAAWSAVTAYVAGNRVIRTTTHCIYERLVSGTTATAPEDDATNWIKVGPTNRWAMFDQATGTQSTAATSMTVVITPGLVRGLALLDLAGNSVTVTMTDGATTVFTRTINLNAGYGVFDWYTYFFSPIVLKSTVIITDLPPYSGGVITITVAGDSTVAIGTVAVGQVVVVGESLYDMELSGTDYSVKTTDSFGTTSITERPYKGRVTVPIVLRASDVDEASRRLVSLRAKPSVWIGASNYDQSVIYGYPKSWSIRVPRALSSQGTITIEGI